jgi:hypothetical protein
MAVSLCWDASLGHFGAAGPPSLQDETARVLF